MSSANGDRLVRDVFYYLLLLISIPLGFMFALTNFSSLVSIYKHNYDSSWGYDFLEGKQAFYYSIIWFVELTILLLLMTYFGFRRKRKLVVVLCGLVLISIIASILIYKIMTGFREA
jgi:hypothetical protein